MSSWAERPAVWLVQTASAFFRLFGGRACRFEPSCSAYVSAAFRKFGFWKAFGLSFFRIVKCGPWHRGGFDPLP